MRKLYGVLALLFFVICFLSSASAAPLSPEQKLAQCLKHAEALPDDTIAEAESWLKKDGGDRARTCHAFAQFHRGEYILAAQEFAALAVLRDTKDRKHAASLHAQAGLSYMRADDHKKAESEYTAALRLEKQDPDIWMDRATERASVERYWDAIDDLNHALILMPDMTEALRLRGQAWAKLGQDSNAKLDFERAAMLDSAENAPAPPK
jgi:tetratricopeptide (TPR) repeat protein